MQGCGFLGFGCRDVAVQGHGCTSLQQQFKNRTGARKALEAEQKLGMAHRGCTGSELTRALPSSAEKFSRDCLQQRGSHEHPGFSRVWRVRFLQICPSQTWIPHYCDHCSCQHRGAARAVPASPSPHPQCDISLPLGPKEWKKNNLKIFLAPLVSNDGRTIFAASIFSSREQIWGWSALFLGRQEPSFSSRLTDRAAQEG